MKKLILLLIIIFCLLSCNFFGPIDNNNKMILDIDEKDLYGTWIIDKFSYKLIEEKGINDIDSIKLIFHKNNEFEISNLPYFFSSFNSKKANKVSNLEKGTWEIKKINDTNELILTFEKSKFFSDGFSTNFITRENNNKIVLFYFIGDPDNGERFLFHKIINKD